MEAIKVKVNKLMYSGFIHEEQHPNWVANIIPVLKKNDKIWICINFLDLNIARPIDESPRPITDVMINNTCKYQRISFMDSFLGYRIRSG